MGVNEEYDRQFHAHVTVTDRGLRADVSALLASERGRELLRKCARQLDAGVAGDAPHERMARESNDAAIGRDVMGATCGRHVCHVRIGQAIAAARREERERWRRGEAVGLLREKLDTCPTCGAPVVNRVPRHDGDTGYIAYAPDGLALDAASDLANE